MSDILQTVLATNTLFDKVIDVELIVTEDEDAANGYWVQQTDAVLPLVPAITGSISGGLQQAVLVRYHGFIHNEYVPLKPKVPGVNSFEYVQKKVVATGSTYKYDFSDPSHVRYFNMGIRPSGQPLKSGDKLYVNDNGVIRTYHVGTRLDNDKAFGNYTVRERIKITTPDTGIKPDISFTLKEIPGGNCYNCILRITNLIMDVDVRKITRVKITAGYRTGNITATFDCPVFSSSIESPNPDGVTVFNCIAVGRTDMYLDRRRVKFEYKGGSETIRSFLAKLASAFGLTDCNKLHNTYNNYTISINKGMSTTANSPMAVIAWAQRVVKQTIQVTEKATADDSIVQDEPNVIMQVTPYGLYTYCTNRLNADSFTRSVNITKLDAIKGATYNGVALTLKTIWHPRIRPGEMFLMDPNVMNGKWLPNILDKALYTGDNTNRYRCITVDVAFSTNDNTNEMTILAVPESNLADNLDTTAAETERTIEAFAAEQRKAAMGKDVTPEIEVVLGQAVDAKGNAEEEKALTDTNAARTTLLSTNITTGSWIAKAYQVQSGESLSVIADRFYGGDGGKGGMAPAMIAMKNGAKIKYNSLWPLIAVYTRNFFDKDMGMGVNASTSIWDPISNDKDPTQIQAGKYLNIPGFSSWDDLKPFAKVFRLAPKMYTEKETCVWRTDWDTLATYLEGS